MTDTHAPQFPLFAHFLLAPLLTLPAPCGFSGPCDPAPPKPQQPLRACQRALGAVGLALSLVGLPTAHALELDDVVTGNTLRFLAQRPDPDAYWYASRVHISKDSLRTGLVTLSTCHHQLDPIHHIVVAFNAQRVQRIAVASSQGVGSAQVEGNRVNLRDVRKGASVCIDLTSRALDAVGPGQWRLHAGPLMRRYLDGYLPMQAQLSFDWPPGLLAVAATEPTAQPGVALTQSDSGARMDITFAGRMRATLDLQGQPPTGEAPSLPNGEAAQ